MTASPYLIALVEEFSAARCRIRRRNATTATVEEKDAAEGRAYQVRCRIRDYQAASVADLIVKLRFMACEYGGDSDDYDTSLEWFVRPLLRDVQRLTEHGGAS